jgi:hypothetical protein
LRSSGILSLVIGCRILSEWITPSSEPSAAYTFETVPFVIGLRLASEGAES